MPILTGIVLVVTLGIAGIAVICFCIYLWINQVTLIHAYIGNSLRRRRFENIMTDSGNALAFFVNLIPILHLILSECLYKKKKEKEADISQIA